MTTTKEHRDWRLYPHMTQQEQADFRELLQHILPDTMGCWESTRLNGMPATLACDQGNISIELLRAFDAVARLAIKNQRKASACWMYGGQK